LFLNGCISDDDDDDDDDDDVDDDDGYDVEVIVHHPRW